MRVRDAEIRELMDIPSLTPDELRRCLRDLRFINAVLGWKRFTVAQVARAVQMSGARSFSLLDIASGSADIPLAIGAWAQHNNIVAHIVATDLSEGTLAVARERVAALPNVVVERQDALALTYAPGSFDIALCTLALHHFAPEDAVAVLASMARVARRVFVFDLVRSRLAYIGAVLLTGLPTMDRITRHDGPASVRRAYTAAELREMAQRAGLARPHIYARFPFRLVLEAEGMTSAQVQEAHYDSRRRTV